MITGEHIAQTAINSGLLGTPYKELDCQAFVEVILKRAGLNIPNYRGSNHMWRSLVYDRQKVKGGKPPMGSLAFIVRNDGGEVKRGYHDDMGNATHVAIVVADGKVMESTTGGVQYGNLSRFTDFALIHDVDYTNGKGGGNDAGEISPDNFKDTLWNLIHVLQDNLTELEVFLDEHFGNPETD